MLWFQLADAQYQHRQTQPEASQSLKPEGGGSGDQTIQTKKRIRACISSEKKPDQSEAVNVVSEPTSRPAVNADAGEYVAHEVKIVTPNSNLNSVHNHQAPPSATAPPGLSAGIVQADMPAMNPPSQVKSPIGPESQQSLRNNGAAPSFILVPKRRLLHNVRSMVKATVPGNWSLFHHIS